MHSRDLETQVSMPKKQCFSKPTTITVEQRAEKNQNSINQTIFRWHK